MCLLLPAASHCRTPTYLFHTAKGWDAAELDVLMATPVRKILSAKSVLDASWLWQLQSAGQHPFPAPSAAGWEQPFIQGLGRQSTAQHSTQEPGPCYLKALM